MKNTILVLSILAFIASSCRQASNRKQTAANDNDICAAGNAINLFFPLSNEFEWADIEQQNQELKATFIQNLPDDLEFYNQHGEMSDLENSLHIVDFNGDGVNDIIFNGFLGGEAENILIFMNTGRSFVKIFAEQQKFHKIIFENGKARQLYIHDGGCCCDYIARNKIYSVDYSAELPKFNMVSAMQFVNIDEEEYPDKYFDRPVKFKVLNEQYNLRFSPVIDDTTDVWYCGDSRIGNSLGKLKSGSTGYALGEKTDATGRTWWFTALLPNTEIIESIYYDEDIASYKMGWISSRFVQELVE